MMNVKSRRPKIALPMDQVSQIENLPRSVCSPAVGKFLDEELDRVQILADGSRSAQFAQLGSLISYRDEGTGETREVTLVLPGNADVERRWISVLTPVGAALLGMKTGSTIAYPVPDGTTRELTVLSVLNVR